MSEVPFVDLRANSQAMLSEALDAMRGVVERSSFVLGAEVRAFEAEFATYCQVRHGIGVDSGTSALELALRALGVGPGDEVVTTANTFVATVFAIRYTGAQPILVDVDPETATMDPEALERAVTARTKVVVPVHLYGQPADMEPIKTIADRHGFAILEDACQAHGADYRERRCGSLGDAAAFSFYPSKNLGAFGDGGLVVTDRDDVAARLRGLRDYGQTEKYKHAFVGFNRRLDELHATVLRLKLKRLDDWNRARRQAAAWYAEALRDVDVVLPYEAKYARHVWHLYVVRVRERERLRAHLDRAGVHTGIHYPIPIHLQEACADLGYRAGDFPVTERLAAEILSLPMFPELTEKQVGQVAEAIRGFAKGA